MWFWRSRDCFSLEEFKQTSMVGQDRVMAENMQLCVFDMRRGVVEGQELEKILFFWPPSWPLPSQLSFIGLSEGLITFTRIFSPESPCELIGAEQQTHIFYECEPDLWMVLAVTKRKDSQEAPRAAAVRAMLRQAHELFVLFYGPIRALLGAHPNGDIARSCLNSFFPDYLSDFGRGKKFRLANVGDCLAEKGFVQFLLPHRETVLESLSLQCLLKAWFGGRTVRHVLILFQNMLLSSTLPQADTTALFQFATSRLIPSQVRQTSSKHTSVKELRLGISAALSLSVSSDPSNQGGHLKLRHRFNHMSTAASSSGETIAPPNVIPDVVAPVREGKGPKRFMGRPLLQEAWWQGVDGFLDTHAWDTEEGRGELPFVWLNSADESMRLCTYQYRSMTIMMLLCNASDHELISALKRHVLDKAAQKIHNLEERLVKEWPGVNAWHISGYRYLYCDWHNRLSRFSPSSKIGSLSKESLATLIRIRADVDLERGRVEGSFCARDREFELCVKTKENAWVIVRCRRGHELYLVLERTSNTLLLACEAVEKLSKRYFNGLFCSN